MTKNTKVTKSNKFELK